MGEPIQLVKLLRDFLTYHETIQGHSPKTADEYYLDLRTFFRYLKLASGQVPDDTPFDKIEIDNITLDQVGAVTLTDVYGFINFLSRERGLGAAARARKISAIRSFYKYLTVKAKLLPENPVQELDYPRLKKSLPRYLNLEQSIQLLESVQGVNQERDLCIMTLFLNCGLRISELIGLNVQDIQGNQLRVLGKGNKERVLFLNDACIAALDDWLAVRSGRGCADPNALFISSQSRKRISKSAVEKLVKKHLLAAGLDGKISPHKLRHTAATLMLQNGVDVRTLQEVLGHDNLNTTQIYTHVESANLRAAAQANPLGHVNVKKQKNPNK
ncbi:MAG: tyrosine recombinase XerC [Oscillospiraceae bacterium]|nr:tyrosine recombinase XerC [Oscillospiraceae bacterium]